MCAACSIISVLTQWGATLVIKNKRERERERDGILSWILSKIDTETCPTIVQKCMFYVCMQNISLHPEGERSPRTEWEGEGGEAVSPDASWTIVLYGAGALRHAAQLPAARRISRGGGATARSGSLRIPSV